MLEIILLIPCAIIPPFDSLDDGNLCSDLIPKCNGSGILNHFSFAIDDKSNLPKIKAIDTLLCSETVKIYSLHSCRDKLHINLCI